jgi:hypothetical protein
MSLKKTYQEIFMKSILALIILSTSLSSFAAEGKIKALDESRVTIGIDSEDMISGCKNEKNEIIKKTKALLLEKAKSQCESGQIINDNSDYMVGVGVVKFGTASDDCTSGYIGAVGSISKQCN